MIYQYSRKTDALLIKNVIDYPHKSLKHYNLSDIFVIFNLDIISEIELVEENLTFF